MSKWCLSFAIAFNAIACGQPLTTTNEAIPKTARPETKKLLADLLAAYGNGDKGFTDFLAAVQAVAESGDPYAIPTMIGIIDADNSYDTVYGVGYFGLGHGAMADLTGVRYRSFHDGAWWRRWWERNKQRFPEDLQAFAIPSLPKFKHGEGYTPYSSQLDTTTGQMEYLTQMFAAGDPDLKLAGAIAEALGEAGDPSAIPLLIGVIDADNGYDTVYGIGYFALCHSELGKQTGVQYRFYHDGAWWRRWWEANKQRFPENAQGIAIPDFPKTAHGKQHTYFPESLDTVQGKIDYLIDEFTAGKTRNLHLSDIAGELGEAGDPRAIPVMIGVIDADNTYDTIYGVGYFGLGKLTGVDYEESHDGAWWRRWWDANKANFPADAQAIAIPDFGEVAAEARKARQAMEQAKAEDEFADAPCIEVHIDGDEHKRYFLIGPAVPVNPPDDGYNLVVILPGSDGGETFNPFVRRIFMRALDRNWIVAEPVSVQWTPSQRVVWPTETNRVEGQQFSTEAFVESVVADVKSRYTINGQHVFTLSWSSSGPAAYSVSLQPESAVTGSYVAMSVFKPETLPPLNHAQGHRYYIEHSPDDKICPYEDARRARTQLGMAGGIVASSDYDGGHGWHGDVYGRIRTGMDWLCSK